MTTSEKLRDFEQRLRCALPDDYKSFLQTHTHQLLPTPLAFCAPRSGSIDQLLTIDDLLRNDERNMIGLPEKHLMHIGHNIFGGYLYLDVSDSAFGAVRYSENYVLREHFASFTEFLEQTVPEDY